MKQASKHMIEDSAINAMKKYKELLDADIITKEEFDEKKKELLGIYKKRSAAKCDFILPLTVFYLLFILKPFLCRSDG